MKKRVYELTTNEARHICLQQHKCDKECPLFSINGCLRAVAGYNKAELFKKVEVKEYGNK